MYLEVALIYGWLKTFSPRNASSWGSRSLRIEGCATGNQRSELQMCEPKNATKNTNKALPNECHDDVIEYHWFLKCTVLECHFFMSNPSDLGFSRFLCHFSRFQGGKFSRFQSATESWVVHGRWIHHGWRVKTIEGRNPLSNFMDGFWLSSRG